MHIAPKTTGKFTTPAPYPAGCHSATDPVRPTALHYLRMTEPGAMNNGNAND